MWELCGIVSRFGQWDFEKDLLELDFGPCFRFGKSMMRYLCLRYPIETDRTVLNGFTMFLKHINLSISLNFTVFFQQHPDATIIIKIKITPGL